jgi:uncharacterized membrane protein
MKNHKYKSIGAVVGLIISLVWLSVFSISNNPFFFILASSGLAIGYLFGWGFDVHAKKKYE